jgi:SAM-dependent methyltransferase
MSAQPSPGSSSAPSVVQVVEDFYDRYPYPPPVDNLDRYRRVWADPARRRADYHLSWPTAAYRDDRSILVAGCGTSQAAKHSLRWPAAQVTGIDLSETSVRATEDLQRKYQLDNLTVHHLPIEAVGELGQRFEQIVCTGVLHHLADPDLGLAALHDVLEPDGAMHLMVYAPYGRTGVYMLQEFCRRLGIQATDEGIRDLVGALGALPPGHPLEHVLREAPDFRSESALADALLHPQDRAYSVPQFYDFLERAGLTMGRWVRQAQYSAHCGAMAQIPQAAALARLPAAEQAAAVELFRGTMVRHSAIVHRRDDPSAPRAFDLAGDEWLSFIPIRLPDTICVQERLPPGAAGVLINQSHTYRDMYLPIDGDELRVFNAIDGAASIGDVLVRATQGSMRPGQVETTRAFFERLWWYDQVVFDRSQVRPSPQRAGAA